MSTVLEAQVSLDRGAAGLEADLRLEDGVTALFGPSGAGKTTLLHCIAGLCRPDEGRIVLDGTALFDSRESVCLPPEKRRAGVVFQDLRLFPHLTVKQNLDFGRAADAPTGVEDVLELVPLLDRRPGTLSGGEARRAALGRALVAAPRILLLDEPTAGLDEARKSAVLSMLSRVRAEFGLPMLLVSHDLSDILQVTTEIAVMEAGRILGQGSLTEVLGADRVLRMAASLGLESVLSVEIVRDDPEAGLTVARAGGCEVLLPRVDRPPGTIGVVALRPEDVILAREPVSGISAQNALPGTVTHVARLSDRLLVSVDLGGGGALLRAEITSRSERQLGIAPGVRVHCLVKVTSFRWRRLPEPGPS